MKRQLFLLFSAVLAMFLMMNVSAEAGKGHPDQFPPRSMDGEAEYTNQDGTCIISVNAYGGAANGYVFDDLGQGRTVYIRIFDATSMKSTSKSITMNQQGYLQIYIYSTQEYFTVPSSSMNVSANAKKGTVKLSINDASLQTAVSQTQTSYNAVVDAFSNLPWLKLKNGKWSGSCNGNFINEI